MEKRKILFLLILIFPLFIQSTEGGAIGLVWSGTNPLVIIATTEHPQTLVGEFMIGNSEKAEEQCLLQALLIVPEETKKYFKVSIEPVEKLLNPSDRIDVQINAETLQAVPIGDYYANISIGMGAYPRPEGSAGACGHEQSVIFRIVESIEILRVLEIFSEPELYAEILVDGIPYGRTPKHIGGLSPSEYQIEIKNPKGYSFINWSDGETSNIRTVSLEDANGKLIAYFVEGTTGDSGGGWALPSFPSFSLNLYYILIPVAIGIVFTGVFLWRRRGGYEPARVKKRIPREEYEEEVEQSEFRRLGDDEI